MIDPYVSPMPRVRAETRTPDDLTRTEWEELEDRLTKVVMSLVFHFPLMGYFIYELKANLVWMTKPTTVNGQPFQTMATDGKSLFAWPFFVLHAPEEQLKAVCLHEALHCVFMHLGRRAGRDAKRWNAAVDYVVNMTVNDLAREMRKIPLPPNGFDATVYKKMDWFIPTEGFYYDERFREAAVGSVEGESYPAERIYDMLTDGCGEGEPLDVHDLEGLPGAQKPDPVHVLNRVRAAHARATTGGKDRTQGFHPASLECKLKEWLYPPLPWQQFLLRWMTSAPGRWGWAPGDLRHEDSMPARRRIKRVEYLPVILDTSGSMSDDEIAAAIAECRAIISQFKGVEGILIQCDAGVQYVGKLADPYPIIRGGGGTTMTPAFEYLEKEGLLPKTKVALCFTDGYLYNGWDATYTATLGIDILWVITNHQVNVPEAPHHYSTRLHSIADALGRTA